MRKQLASSELVLNPDGSIYHLNLKPEQIATTIIVVGDPGRVSSVSKYFDEIEYQTQKREFITHTGRLGNRRLTVISTGIGGGNIDIVLNELDALVNIDLENRYIKTEHTSLDIIRIGTSGGIQADIDCDTFVASNSGLGLDGVLHFFKHENSILEQDILSAFNQYWDQDFGVKPYFFTGSDILLNTIGSDMKQGITATAGGFYAAQGRQLKLAPKLLNLPELLHGFSHNDYRITNFEMETATIYGLARLLGHRALSFNAILANRVNGTFSKKPYVTIDKLIRTVLEKLA